jgi:hypothetical protein
LWGVEEGVDDLPLAGEIDMLGWGCALDPSAGAAGQLITTGSGFSYFPARILRSQVTLADWPSDEPAPQPAKGRHKNKQRKKKPRAGK